MATVLFCQYIKYNVGISFHKSEDGYRNCATMKSWNTLCTFVELTKIKREKGKKKNFREQIHCMFLNSVRYGEDRKEMKIDKV